VKRLALASSLLLAALPMEGLAQSASLLNRAIPRGAYTTKDVSPILLPRPAPLGLHDLLTIQVDERTIQQINARTNRRRQTNYEINFDELIVLLSGLRLRADQSIRDQRPAIEVEALNDIRNTMQANRSDRLNFSIQAEIVEVKPNSDFVIEAHGMIEINNEVSSYTISGVVSSKDVNLTNRSVKSEKIAHKRVKLVQIGPARDALKRGWLVRLVDMFTIF
jgi:flagellar basal body L-ring protein FlgH